MHNIPVYIVNIKKRHDRLTHIKQQFQGRPEFSLHFIEAHEHQVGAIGLWHTLQDILQIAIREDHEYVVLCEDDHKFENAYHPNMLTHAIAAAKNIKADVLLGGIGWCNNAIQVADSLVWIDKFSCTQFTILFKQFYKKLLYCHFTETDAIDFKISALTKKKYVVFPFISTQEEFGYSDASELANTEGLLSKAFRETENRIAELLSLRSRYAYNKRTIVPKGEITIPAYLTSLEPGSDKYQETLQELKAHTEFELRELPVDIMEGRSYRQQLLYILDDAISKDDDAIMICKDNHQFNRNYNFRQLMKNIMIANAQDAEILLGGTNEYSGIVPVNKELYWVFWFKNQQCSIIFGSVFSTLRELLLQADDSIEIDQLIAEHCTNKMICYPFVTASKEKEETTSSFFNSEMEFQDVNKVISKFPEKKNVNPIHEKS